MAVQILKRIISRTPHPNPVSLSFSSSSPSSSSVSTAVSVLANHRSKSRWTNLRSLFPTGFTPHQFSQITLHLKNNPHLALNFFLFTRQHSLCLHNLSSLSTVIHILARGRLKSRAKSLIRSAIRVAEDSNPLKVFESLVRTYTQCGSAPFVFDLLIKACLEAKNIDGSIEIVRMLMSRGISPQICACNALILEVFRYRGLNAGYGIYREVFALDGEEKVVRVKPNIHTFNMLMECFYREGAVERVEEVWAEIMEMNCVPDVYSYSVLMAAYCDEGKMGEVENLWEEMRFKEIEPDIVTYNTIIGGFCKIGEIAKAEEFFREMELNRVGNTCVTYEHLLNGYCRVGHADSAVLLYKDMRRKQFRAEASTVDAVIRVLCNKRRVFEALQVLRAAVGDYGFSPKGVSYEVLIKVLCEEGKMEEALKLQAEMVGTGFEPNTEIYISFIDGYTKQGNDEVAERLRKEML